MVLSQEPRFIETALATLYLRGGPGQPTATRSRWPSVVSTLRSASMGANLPQALRDRGLWAEALILEDTDNVDWGAEQVNAGRCLCVTEDVFPQRWVHALGKAAPPVLWKRGSMPTGPYLGIVGSREISDSVSLWVHQVALEAVRLGYTVVSGGAKGCDRTAEEAALSVGAPVVRLTPYGLGNCSVKPGVCQLCACPPDQDFSSANAMERNTLIYACSDHTIVGHSRYGHGGTWSGAMDAHRRKLCRLIVREDPESEAHSALIQIGAVSLSHPKDLDQACLAPPLQRTLFQIG